MLMTTLVEGKSHILQTGDMKQEMGRMMDMGSSPSDCYAHSFGPLAHKSCYMNGWQKDAQGNHYDLRTFLGAKAIEGYDNIAQKALGPTAGGAGTAGYALVPVFLDPRVVDTTRKYTPLVEQIPRVANLGSYADYNEITAKGAAFTANADAPMTENDDTVVRRSKEIKYLYSVGRVLGPMQAAMPSMIMQGFQPSGAGNIGGSVFTPANAPNAKQFQVLLKARAMKELEENLIVNGDSSTDATQYDGIVKQMGTTNQRDLANTAMSWDDVESSVQDAYDDGGRPSLAVGSSAVITDLRKIMIDTFRFTPQQLVSGASLAFGIPPQLVLWTMVGPIPAIPSMYLSNTTGAKQLFFLDMDWIEMRVLQDMTYEELAHVNDSQKFMLKIYEVLVIKSTAFHSFIDNIA